MIDSLDERLLAKELGVDSSTVRRRVKKLIGEGVIYIAAIPDPDRVGSHFVAIVAFDIAYEKIEAVLDFWLDITTQERVDIRTALSYRAWPYY